MSSPTIPETRISAPPVVSPPPSTDRPETKIPTVAAKPTTTPAETFAPTAELTRRERPGNGSSQIVAGLAENFNVGGGQGAHMDSDDEAHHEETELEKRDEEVQQHENEHLAALDAGGIRIGNASYKTRQSRLTGKSFAVSGEVPVDPSEAETPEKTVKKMATIYDAALRPKNPSAQDYAMAGEALRKKASAQVKVDESNNHNRIPGATLPRPPVAWAGFLSQPTVQQPTPDSGTPTGGGGSPT